MNIGETIKRVRMALYLEQEEFGKLIGVSKGSVCHYEKGARKPRLPIIRAIIALAKKNKIKINAEDFLK